MKSVIKTLFKNEAFHFTIIGLILFSVSFYFDKKINKSKDTITLTKTEIDNLLTHHKKTFGKEPNLEVIAKIKNQAIKRKILVQEAKKIGLNDNDLIIERRLAQKMTFLFKNNVIAKTNLSDLKKHYEENKNLFVKNSQFGFKHKFYSTDKNETLAHKKALSALKKLKANSTANIKEDTWYLGATEALRGADQIDSLFGIGFSSELEKSKTNSWQGPYRSAYGYHVVYLENKIPSHTPDFEFVKLSVWKDFQLKKSQQNLDNYLKSMTKSYRIKYEASL